MLGHDTTKLLKVILETISQAELSIEYARQDLCSVPTFAPYSAFCRIDRGAKECLDACQIYAFLRENSAPASMHDCARLVSFFDSDHDGYLSYADFIQIVLPCDNKLLRLDV